MLTFESFLKQKGDRTFVVDQHPRTGVLVQDDVCHPKVLLICQYYASAKQNIVGHKLTVRRERSKPDVCVCLYLCTYQLHTANEDTQVLRKIQHAIWPV